MPLKGRQYDINLILLYFKRLCCTKHLRTSWTGISKRKWSQIITAMILLMTPLMFLAFILYFYSIKKKAKDKL